MAFDIDQLSTQLGGLVQITVPENGDLDELGTALSELSVRGIKLTGKFIKAKATETKLRMSLMQMKAEMDAASSRIIATSEEYTTLKNEGQRKAHIEVALSDEVSNMSQAEIQHANVKSVVELISDAISCLKFLKENISRQIQLREIEAALEPKE